MKIIGGTYKNRNLKAPKGLSTRPSSSQLREALFNILQNRIEGAHFLDLFAGSGAIGLEALSRGAEKAAFVEKEPRALRCLKENIAALDADEKSAVLSGDLFVHLKRLRTEFDIIFADPPYETASISDTLLRLIDESALLKSGGLFFLEESERAVLNVEGLKTLVLKNKRKFGRSALFQFEKL